MVLIASCMVFFDALLVALLVKIFLAFYKILSFITPLTKAIY
jgi:hypothetical protein